MHLSLDKYSKENFDQHVIFKSHLIQTIYEPMTKFRGLLKSSGNSKRNVLMKNCMNIRFNN